MYSFKFNCNSSADRENEEYREKRRNETVFVNNYAQKIKM